jgi:hypothetical protein
MSKANQEGTTDVEKAQAAAIHESPFGLGK